jgi:chromosome partitioning protein
MKVITVSHLKGGSAKTTTAGYLAHALEDLGHNVLVIDADPQGSLLRWSRRGQWTIPVRHMHGTAFANQLAGLYTDPYDYAVVDTNPHDVGQDGGQAGAMRAADIVLVPTAATFMEAAEIRTTYAFAERAGVDPGALRILLNRAPANSVAAKDLRQVQAAAGRIVLNAQIGNRSVIAQASSGRVNPALGFGGYIGVALELTA